MIIEQEILKKGLVINRVSYNNGTVVLHTSKGMLFIAPAGGAAAELTGFEPTSSIKIKSVTQTPYEIEITFVNNKKMTIADDTGGETLEIWTE